MTAPAGDHPSAAAFVPAGAGIERLRDAARTCKGCDLYKDATQTVFSKGPAGARLVFVGEQPGDIEDQRGEPFVGPAGKLLDRAIAEAGIEPADTYTTNAVKHFKFRRGNGPRRIHATPEAAEIAACRPWLVAEFSVLQPEVIVVLGATAAKALFGPAFRVTRSRGILRPWPASAAQPEDFELGEDAETRPPPLAMATVHPSAVLRADDRDQAFAGLVADLAVAASVLHPA